MVAGDDQHRLGEDRECVVLILLLQYSCVVLIMFHQYPSLRLVASRVVHVCPSTPSSFCLIHAIVIGLSLSGTSLSESLSTIISDLVFVQIRPWKDRPRSFKIAVSCVTD
jgi:hypothetical protein